MPTDLDYLSPLTVEEAVALRAGNPASAYLLGGTDLLPQMRAGRRRPERLVDLKRIPELQEIRVEANGDLAIGAAVSLADLETHRDVLARFPLLAECVKTVGAWPLRQRATLAGNVCNASPAADTAVALLALDAVVNVASATGPQSIPLERFFLGPGLTALVPGDLVTDVVLPGGLGGVPGLLPSPLAAEGDGPRDGRRPRREVGRRRAGALARGARRRRADPAARNGGRGPPRGEGGGRRARGRGAGRRGLPPDHGPARERGVPARHGRRPRPPRPSSSWAEGGGR